VSDIEKINDGRNGLPGGIKWLLGYSTQIKKVRQSGNANFYVPKFQYHRSQYVS